MNLSYPKEMLPNPLNVLRQAGYAPFTDPNTGEHSFIIRLGSDFYPRFHLYINEKDEEIIFSLHLDQKKPSYGSGHMHGGEYEGPVVKKEAARIEGWVRHSLGM